MIFIIKEKEYDLIMVILPENDVEESSIVMNDGTIIQGETGPLPTIENGVQTATSSLPNLPTGTTPLDVEATIHSHPIEVQQVNNYIFPQSANNPSAVDRITFNNYDTNIIVGPLGTIKYVSSNANGSVSVPNRKTGAVIFNSHGDQLVSLTRRAIQRILK